MCVGYSEKYEMTKVSSVKAGTKTYRKWRCPDPCGYEFTNPIPCYEAIHRHGLKQVSMKPVEGQ